MRQEEIRETGNTLGIPEEEYSARFQTVVKQWQNLLLQFGLKIDQQVSTGENVEVAEGGIRHEILDGKHNHPSNLTDDTVAVLFLDKKAIQSFGRYAGHHRLGKETLSGVAHGIMVEVRCENLQGMVSGMFDAFQGLLEHDGQRVRLFTGRASDDPGPQTLSRLTRFQQGWQNVVA